jgi:hypothetical protein
MARERESRLVFGKIFFDDWIENKSDKLWELVGSRNEFQTRKGDIYWVFANAEKLNQINGYEGEYIFGKLAKVKGDFVHKKYDRKTGTIIEELEKEGQEVKDYSNFVIDYNKNYIVFEERPFEISIKQFKENFLAMYSQQFQEVFGRLRIGVITEAARIFEEIKKYDKVTKVKFSIVYPNPRDRPEYEGVKKEMEKMNAKKWASNIDGKENGLNVEDTHIGEGLHLIEEGYGEDYTIYVEKGRKKSIITIDKIKRKVIRTEGDNESIIKTFLEELKEYIKNKDRKR